MKKREQKEKKSHVAHLASSYPSILHTDLDGVNSKYKATR